MLLEEIIWPIITGVSLIASIAAALVVWRSVRELRRISDVFVSVAPKGLLVEIARNFEKRFEHFQKVEVESKIAKNVTWTKYLREIVALKKRKEEAQL